MPAAAQTKQDYGLQLHSSVDQKYTKQCPRYALSQHPTSNPLPHEIMAEIDAEDNPEPSITDIRAISTDHPGL